MEEVFAVIRKLLQGNSGDRLLLAIDGRCAAGKTTLAAGLHRVFGGNVIHMDDFFLQPHQRTKERLDEPGGNVDYERFLEEVMLPLQAGKPFSYRKFDCKQMDFSAEIAVKPNRLTIVEGAYSCHPALWNFYDLHIFLDIEPKEQLRRIAARNGEQALPVFRERWIPLEEKYFFEYNIREECEYIFYGR